MTVTRLRGAEAFRARLVLATISGQPIRIDGIREDDPTHPGLREHEASLLRLLEKVSRGARVEINETGTTLRYRPGVLVGGSVEHECPKGRGVGYFLEALLLLGLFGRKPLRATLRGVTCGGLDGSADAWRTVGLPLVRRCLGVGVQKAASPGDANFAAAAADAAAAALGGGTVAAGDLALRLVRRGVPPLGGGEVVLDVPCVRCLPPLTLLDEGAVRRVRGVAFAARVAPAAAARAVDGCRGVLNKLLADVFVFTDHAPGQATGGLSPGYGLTLVAETTSGCLLGAEACSSRDDGGGGAGAGGTAAAAAKSSSNGTKPSSRPPPPLAPEDVGSLAAQALLDEVDRGGVCSAGHQGLLLLLAACSDASASQVRLGPLTPHAAATLRAARDVLGIEFALRPEPRSRTVFASCIGAGLRNTSRVAT